MLLSDPCASLSVVVIWLCFLLCRVRGNPDVILTKMFVSSLAFDIDLM